MKFCSTLACTLPVLRQYYQTSWCSSQVVLWVSMAAPWGAGVAPEPSASQKLNNGCFVTTEALSMICIGQVAISFPHRPKARLVMTMVLLCHFRSFEYDLHWAGGHQFPHRPKARQVMTMVLLCHYRKFEHDLHWAGGHQSPTQIKSSAGHDNGFALSLHKLRL